MLDAAAKAGAAHALHAGVGELALGSAAAHAPHAPPAELTPAEMRSKIMRQVRPARAQRPAAPTHSPSPFAPETARRCFWRQRIPRVPRAPF
jgi:hypothetical protein